MPHLDQDNRTYEFKFKDRVYRAEYIWCVNSIAISIKSPSGKWNQINANSKKAEQIIAQKKLTWGDYRAPIKRSEQATAH